MIVDVIIRHSARDNLTITKLISQLFPRFVLFLLVWPAPMDRDERDIKNIVNHMTVLYGVQSTSKFLSSVPSQVSDAY